jgi:hypothetical protein
LVASLNGNCFRKRPIESALKLKSIGSGFSDSNHLPQMLSECRDSNIICQILKKLMFTTPSIVNYGIPLLKLLQDRAATILRCDYIPFIPLVKGRF